MWSCIHGHMAAYQCVEFAPVHRASSQSLAMCYGPVHRVSLYAMGHWIINDHSTESHKIHLKSYASIKGILCSPSSLPSMPENILVSPGIEKTVLSSSPVTNNCKEKPALIRNLVTFSEVQLGGVKPSWARWMCCVDCPYPSCPCPPHCWPSDMWGETSIFWVLRNNSSIHSIAVTQSCGTLVLTASSSSS